MLRKQAFPKKIQQRWTNIVKATKTAAENTLGIQSKENNHVNKKIN